MTDETQLTAVVNLFVTIRLLRLPLNLILYNVITHFLDHDIVIQLKRALTEAYF